MARLLRMPEISANTTEAVLQGWSVSDNATFAADDTLATIETDKASVDIDADAAGAIIKLLVAAGTTVEVGTPIAVLGDPTEAVTDVEALLAELGVQSGLSADGAAGPSRTADGAPSAGPESPASPDGADRPRPPADDDRRGRTFASPLARRLAKEAGLSIDDIPGSGPGARVRRDDVRAAIAARPSAVPAAAAAPPATAAVLPGAATPPAAVPPAAAGSPAAPATVPAAPPAATGPTPADPPDTSAATAPTPYTEIPHPRIRTVIARRLTESKQTIPHFYLQGSADVTALLELRGQLNAAGDVRISVNDLLIKAAARALVEVPEMNVIWTPQAMRQFAGVDMSVAIAAERGLVTPVLRSVERMSVAAVAVAVRDLAARADEGRLRPADIEGGSFTVTNLGMFGVENFAAIINPPQSAILAVGAARTEPVVRDGELVAASILRYTLSVDHRAVDGALAARWLQAFTAILGAPLRILL